MKLWKSLRYQFAIEKSTINAQCFFYREKLTWKDFCHKHLLRVETSFIRDNKTDKPQGRFRDMR